MPVLAIDGPSGAGKSSVAKAIAARYGWSYLDTGALYRALTFFSIDAGIESASEIPLRLPEEAIRWSGNPAKPEIYLGKRLINDEIRTEEVTSRVSVVAADPAVRAFLLSMQRSIINRAARGIVVEGRDIGTTVWPDAELKIFLTADLQARAQRRNAELQANLSDSDVQRSLASRDQIDSTRNVSPLRQSEDQIVIDATHLSFDQVVAEIVHIISELKLSDDDGSHE